MTGRRVDYADRYAVELPEVMDATTFCSLVLAAAPRWLEALLTVRDAVAGRLGFGTQHHNYGRPVELAPGRTFGPLPVRSVAPHRVVCGATDAHLSFEAVFETDPTRPRGSLTTSVQFHDAVGRAYFGLVRPFHRRLIPVLIARPFPGRAAVEPLPEPGGAAAPGGPVECSRLPPGNSEAP